MPRLSLLINARAGAASSEDPDDLRDALVEAARWAEVRVHAVEDDPAKAARDALDADQPDFIAVAGGDGTARGAAEALAAAQSTAALIPLPLGTANMLPRRLYGSRDARTVLEEAEEFETRPLHAGECGGRLFFIAAIAGFPVMFGEAREAVREGAGGMSDALRSSRAAFASMFKRRLRLAEPGERKAFAVASAALFAPGGVEAVTGGPPLDAGPAQLECLHVRLRDPGQMASVTLAAMMDRWREHDAVHRRWVDGAELRGGGKESLMLDGEPLRLEAPVRFTFQENALTVLAAPDG